MNTHLEETRTKDAKGDVPEMFAQAQLTYCIPASVDMANYQKGI